MKSNGLTTILNGVLAVCLAAAVLLALQYFFVSRDLRKMNGQLAGINTWRNGVQAFVADCVEYSKRNPAILPILESVGVGTNRAAGQQRTTR